MLDAESFSSGPVSAIMTTEARSSSKMGYAHYVCFPDDGRRHEIIDGEHYVNPAPSTYHQTVSKRLQYQLYTQIELRGLGILFDAPVDVQLSDHDIVQPDLVIILNPKKTIITPTKIKGIPDLIIEIISPSSVDNDRKLKKIRYEKTGVPEYWVVDPAEHSLEQWVLQDAQYRLQPASDDVRPSVIDGIIVRLSEVW
jgi:Uma2 family endonuclease